MTTNKMRITTVPELISVLVNKPHDMGYLTIMKSLDIPIHEFERYYTWNNNHYTRNCLLKTDDFELLLVCWEKGQKSPIHNFNAGEAWIHPLQGKLIEERYQKTKNGIEQVSSLVLGTKGYSYMTDPIAIHRYMNCYEARTVSLNLYVKPIDKWQEFDRETGASEEKSVGYDIMHEIEFSEEIHNH